MPHKSWTHAGHMWRTYTRICQCAYTTKPRDPYNAIRIAWKHTDSILNTLVWSCANLHVYIYIYTHWGDPRLYVCVSARICLYDLYVYMHAYVKYHRYATSLYVSLWCTMECINTCMFMCCMNYVFWACVCVYVYALLYSCTYTYICAHVYLFIIDMLIYVCINECHTSLC
jgi:hypothetical protein